MATIGGSEMSFGNELNNINKKIDETTKSMLGLGGAMTTSQRVTVTSAQSIIKQIADLEQGIKKASKEITALGKAPKLTLLEKEINGATKNLKNFTEAFEGAIKAQGNFLAANDISSAAFLKNRLIMEDSNREIERNKGIIATKQAELAALPRDQRNLTPEERTSDQNKLIQQREQMRMQLKALRKELNATQKSTKDLSDETFSLTDRIGIAIQKLLIYRIAWGIFRAVQQQISTAIQSARDFNDVIQDLKKVIDPSQGSVDKLSESAFQLGIIFGKSAKEVAATFSTFAQQGLNVNQILDRTVAVLLLSATSAITTGDAVEALTAVFEAYPEYVDRATLAVDKWASVQAKAPLTTQDLAMAMKQIGITAREVGVTFDELSGIVASINEVTRKSGKEIGNSLKTMFANIVAKDAIEQLQSLGINVMKSKTEFRDVADVLTEVNNKWKGFTNQQRVAIAQLIGDKRRYSDFIALMENFGRYTTSTADSILAEGEASKMATFEFEKFNRQIQSIQTVASKLGVTFGNFVLPPLISLFKYVGYFTNALVGTDSTINRINITLASFIAVIYLGQKAIYKLGLNTLFTTKSTEALTVATTQATVAGAAASTTFGLVSKTLGVLGAILAVFSVVNLVIGFNKAKKANDELTQSLKEGTQSLDEWIRKTQEAFNQSKLEDTAKVSQIRTLRTLIDDDMLRLDIMKKQYVMGEQLKDAEAKAAAKKINAENELQRLQTKANIENVKVDPLTGATTVEAGVVTMKERAAARKSATEALGEWQIAARRLNIYKEIINLPDSEKEKVKKQLESAIPENLRKLNEIISPPQKGMALFDLDKTTESLVELTSKLDYMKKTLDLSEQSASTFGTSFNRISKAYEILNQINEEGNSLLIQRNVLQDKLAKLKGLAEASGIRSEQSKEYALEISQLQYTIGLFTNQYNLLKKQLSVYKPITDLYWSQQQALENNKLQMTEENLLLDTQIKLQEAQGKGIQKMSSMKAIDATLLKTVLKEEMAVAQLQKKKELNEANFERLNNLITKGTQDQTVEIEYQSKVREINLKYAKKETEIQYQQYEQAIKMVRNIRDQVREAFSSSFVDLPGKLTEASATIKTINKDRKEAEADLARARSKNDASGINTALKSLNEIDNRMKEARQNQIKAFTDVFGAVGDVAMKKWGENLANYLLNEDAAEKLASGIIPASTQAALQMYNAIIAGGAKIGLVPSVGGISNTATGTTGGIGVGVSSMRATGGIDVGMSSLTTPQQTVTAFNTGSTLASNKLERALEAGGNMAAVAILKSIGVGTGQISNSLSNFGGLLGSAALSGENGLFGNLGKFGGPIGTILGSLLGAGIGSLFESEQKPYIDANTDALSKNTSAVENNNKLLELERQFINAPSNFNVPALYGMGAQGNTSINIVVNGTGSPSDVARQVVNIIDQEYAKSARRTQNTFSRFGK